MKTITIQRRLLQNFVMNEFTSGKMNTQSDIDNIIALVGNKLSISNKEAGEFIYKAINK